MSGIGLGRREQVGLQDTAFPELGGFVGLRLSSHTTALPGTGPLSRLRNSIEFLIKYFLF